MEWVIKRGGSLEATPWQNGQGTTRDIMTVRDDAGRLMWQVGIADLERDADFSIFPGCDRVFTPVYGEVPPELSIDGHPFAAAPFMMPAPFPGDVPTKARITGGSQAFNIIWDREHHDVTVHGMPMEAGETFLPSTGGINVLFCQSGAVSLPGARLDAGDCAFSYGGEGGPLVMAETGALLLAWIG